MKISQNGIDLIKKFEGCRLVAYQDAVGIWTIGYGHISNVKKGDVINQQQAENLLKSDLKKFEEKVMKYYTKYIWTQNEFDALVSFAYNVGGIEQLTANGTRDKKTIASKMLEYTKACGKVLNGLVNRRKEENKLFLKESSLECDVMANINTYSLKSDGDKQVSKNFKVKEFRCKDGSDTILIDYEFVQKKLQNIRDYFNLPVTINSAYRTQSYNAKVGGAKSSYHMKGQAFDIVVKGKTPNEVAKYAQQIGINGIIQYNTFVHVDSRAVKYWAKNNNGKVTVVNGF